VWVDSSVVPIPLFWVDIPASSEGIRFSSEASRAEADGKVELGEILRPVGLMASQDLGAREVLQILVVGDHIDRGGGALEVMSPVLEDLKDGQKLLVVGVIIQLRRGQSVRVVHDRAEDLVGASDGKDSSDGVVRSISLHSQRSVRDPVGKDRSGGEGLLQEVKGGATVLTKIPRNVLAGKPCERYDDVRVVEDETMVEVCKTEKRLNVFHLAGFWPVGDGFDFVGRHGEAIGGEAEAQVFGGGGMEFTFFRLSKEVMLAEVSEDFADMLLM